MIVEQLGLANIAREHLELLLPRHLLHFWQAGAGSRSFRQEPGPERMRPHLARIEPGERGIFLHNPC